MKKRIGIVLSVLFVFFSCENEEISKVLNPGEATLYATIGEHNEPTTRAAIDNTTGTYLSFTNKDKLGLFATQSLRDLSEYNDNSPLDPSSNVNNLKFELIDGKWGGENPLLRWFTVGGESADIYAYYPYQENLGTANSGYNIFTSENSGILKDVLVAERTTVQNNNPAIFLTFKHRFSLVHIQLGTGMGAIKTTDVISLVMDQGFAETATVQADGGVVKLGSGDIDEFISEKRGGSYYGIIPVEKLEAETDSAKLVSVRIGEVSFALDIPVTPKANTVYHLTIHKDPGGSVSIQVGYIEQWTDYSDLSGIREEPGIYWASDMVNLIKQYNIDSSKENSKLELYGTWDDDKECWIFKLCRNIDMLDIGNRNCAFGQFSDIFEGEGYYINGLDINSDSGDVGLFGTLEEGAEINNLTLKDISVTGSAGAGALAAHAEGGVIINNCHVTGVSAVSGNGKTGGLVGEGEPVISRSSASVTVTNGNSADVGGLVGSLGPNGSITNSFVTGAVVSQGNNVGGLAGNVQGKIADCHTSCDVKGTDNVGGLAGTIVTEVSNCHSVGDIEGNDNVGGLLGITNSDVSKSSSNGSVTGNSNVGGLIGTINADESQLLIIEFCSSRSDVIGNSSIGGLIGNATRYVAEHEEPAEEPEDPEEEPGEPITIPARGTLITYSYATNKIQLSGSNEAGLSYCYMIDDGDGDKENHYYEISLDATPDDINELLGNLNSAENTKPWTLGHIVIDGKGYTLPVLLF